MPEASHRAAHSFTLEALPDGRLRYDDGGDVLILAAGGKPVPEPFQPEVSVLSRELTSTSFHYDKMAMGRIIERIEQHLTADGKQLVGRRVVITDDGLERARDLVTVRIGVGRGLTGRWRQLPPPRHNDQSKTLTPTSPFWIIAQDADGVMTWTIPATGEILRGTADGRPYPVGGALRLPGRTFTLRTLAPRHLLWSFYENGHLGEHAEERLSKDGKLWTDLIWKPGHPGERDVFVYRRE